MASIATVPLAGWFWVQILVGITDLTLLQNVQKSPKAHPAFYIRVQGFFSGIKAAGT
jgi:hypothetical protein